MELMPEAHIINISKMRGCKERIQFYRENWNKPISEQEFIMAVRSWPRKCKKNSKTRSMSKSRIVYWDLKIRYGFFKGSLI